MRLGKIIGATLIAGLTILLPSCKRQKFGENRVSLLKEVMQNNSQNEFDIIYEGLPKSGPFVEAAGFTQIQHKIDSVAFSEMFKGSQKANDSAFVADYNAMMAKTKTPTYLDSIYNPRTGITSFTLCPNGKAMDKQLANVLTVKEMSEIRKNPILENNGSYYKTGKQYLVDSVYHYKLFEKHGLLTPKYLKKFQEICKKVRP